MGSTIRFRTLARSLLMCEHDIPLRYEGRHVTTIFVYPCSLPFLSRLQLELNKASTLGFGGGPCNSPINAFGF